MKLYLLIIVLFLMLGGCVSQEERESNAMLIKKLEISIQEERANTARSAEVQEHNIRFYEEWIVELKNRGYK